jgi:hypothetical protein
VELTRNRLESAAALQPTPTRIVPLAVGLLLGLLQSGLFFQLTFTLSSGFTTYLLITLCWLMGGVIGVTYVRRFALSLRLLLVFMLLAYALCGWLVSANPFNTQLWPLYGGLIGIAGIYPGVFFAGASKLYSARILFFWENNGFIAGLVASTLLFMVFGRGVLWVMPTLFAVVVWSLFPPALRGAD